MPTLNRPEEDEAHSDWEKSNWAGIARRIVKTLNGKQVEVDGDGNELTGEEVNAS